jgi:transposase
LRQPRFRVHFTPTYSSWLNQVERWFGLLKQKALKRGIHRRTLELAREINKCIEASKDNHRPYVWTKSADDIFASFQAFCGRTLESQGVQLNF